MPYGSESTTSTALCVGAAARQTVRYAGKSVETLGKLRALTEQRYEKKYISLGELNTVKIKLKKHATWAGRFRGSLSEGQNGSGLAHEPDARRDSFARAPGDDQ